MGVEASRRAGVGLQGCRKMALGRPAPFPQTKLCRDMLEGRIQEDDPETAALLNKSGSKLGNKPSGTLASGAPPIPMLIVFFASKLYVRFKDGPKGLIPTPAP